LLHVLLGRGGEAAKVIAARAKRLACLASAGLAAAGVCLAATGPVSGQTAAAPDRAVKGQFGGWALECRTPAGAKSEMCGLTQIVVDEKNSDKNLSVLFQKYSTNSQVLRVVVPQSVLLPKGVRLLVDEKDVTVVPFQRCPPGTGGCFADFVVEDALLEQLKKGKPALFIIYRTVEEGIGLPITLSGFAEGYAALK
jgi:invasion protein IalB